MKNKKIIGLVAGIMTLVFAAAMVWFFLIRPTTPAVIDNDPFTDGELSDLSTLKDVEVDPLETDPDAIRSHYLLLSNKYEQEDQSTSAIGVLEYVVELGHADAIVYYRLHNLYLSSVEDRDEEKAADYKAKALELDPDLEDPGEVEEDEGQNEY